MHKEQAPRQDPFEGMTKYELYEDMSDEDLLEMKLASLDILNEAEETIHILNKISEDRARGDI